MLERVWREPSYTLGCNVNWCSHRGKQYGSSSKTKNRVAIWSSNPTLGHILRQNYNLKRYMQPPIFTAALFMTAMYGSNLSVYQQLNGQRRCSFCVYTYIHTMQYYWVIKKKEIMLSATRMLLEIIILKLEKEKYHMIALICRI